MDGSTPTAATTASSACIPNTPCAGIDFSTGSLGQGLSVAVAPRSARACRVARRVFVLLSDAECNEGSVWEAIMFAAHHRLANLIAIVDVNGQQALGYTGDVLALTPHRAERWRPSAGTSTKSMATMWPLVAADESDSPPGSRTRARADGLRQGRLLHGGPDQVALLADVRCGVRAGARRGGRAVHAGAFRRAPADGTGRPRSAGRAA